MKIGAIIQARMGSTRLSGKVMKDLKGKTVLQHVIDRVHQSEMIDEIIIATTVHNRDNIIEQESLRCQVKVFRGSEENVLSRYYYAAKHYNLDTIVRITSDCPLIDSKVLDEMINHYQKNDYDIVSNTGLDTSNRTYPRGLDTEIFSFDTLRKAFINAKEKYHKEHVTPYIYENFRNVYYYKNDIDYSRYRWTLDTEDDFRLIKEVYNNLYLGKHDFYLKEIIGLFLKKPELNEINSHIEQKQLSSQD